MKTRTSPRILLAISLVAVLGAPAFAAFGDNTGIGSALPPGTYPSSPADADKRSNTPPETKAPAPSKKPKASTGQKKTEKPQKRPRSGS